MPTGISFSESITALPGRLLNVCLHRCKSHSVQGSCHRIGMYNCGPFVHLLSSNGVYLVRRAVQCSQINIFLRNKDRVLNSDTRVNVTQILIMPAGDSLLKFCSMLSQ